MALVSGSPEMSLLVRNRVGSNPTLIIILLFLCSIACYAILSGCETYNFVFGREDSGGGVRQPCEASKFWQIIRASEIAEHEARFCGL
jgi:hypothetical protein